MTSSKETTPGFIIGHREQPSLRDTVAYTDHLLSSLRGRVERQEDSLREARRSQQVYGELTQLQLDALETLLGFADIRQMDDRAIGILEGDGPSSLVPITDNDGRPSSQNYHTLTDEIAKRLYGQFEEKAYKHQSRASIIRSLGRGSFRTAILVGILNGDDVKGVYRDVEAERDRLFPPVEVQEASHYNLDITMLNPLDRVWEIGPYELSVFDDYQKRLYIGSLAAGLAEPPLLAPSPR